MPTLNAVLVVPGLMGSELVETSTGRTLWGGSDPRWYVAAWVSPTGLGRLAVTDDERAGRLGRVRATALIGVPAFAPVFRGVEPYHGLIRALRSRVAAPEAIAAFPYDWRLPVAVNAEFLADTAVRHLARWRESSGLADARLTIVAHSMGGLLARRFVEDLGGADIVHKIVTLGSPFYGAPLAATVIGDGGGATRWLPPRRLGDVARTMPGIHDLLPAYRCVVGEQGLRQLTSDDVARCGGDRDLAATALGAARETRLPAGLRVVVGLDQPTVTRIRLDGERIVGSDDPDGDGDGTVGRDSAQAFSEGPAYFSQSHQGLARMKEAIAHVCGIVTETRIGPLLAERTRLGLRAPDLVTVRTRFRIEALGLSRPSQVSCRVVRVSDDRQISAPLFQREEGRLIAVTALPKEDVYRIEVKSGGLSPVTSLVMVVPADVDGGEAT